MARPMGPGEQVSGMGRALALEQRGQISGTEAQGAKEDHAGLGRGLREPCVHPSPAALSPLQLTASEEEFLRTYAGVVSSQLSQLPQHSIDQGESGARAPATLSWGHLVWFLDGLSRGQRPTGRGRSFLPALLSPRPWSHLVEAPAASCVVSSWRLEMEVSGGPITAEALLVAFVSLWPDPGLSSAGSTDSMPVCGSTWPGLRLHGG